MKKKGAELGNFGKQVLIGLLYGTIMMDTCRCVFVQTHRLYSTKSEP